MQAYRYKAMNDVGRIVRGRGEAINPADLEVRLSRLGLDLVSYRALGAGRRRGARRVVRRPELITFCFQLEHLVRAGVPILAALADLRDSIERRALREVTAALIESIEGGKTLSGAMADFPDIFDPVFVSLIRAGESSGVLSEVLAKIGENLKWQDEQAAQTRRLLIYPAFALVVMLLVFGFLMVSVVPQMVSLLAAMGQALPPQTRVLLVVSRFLAAYWPWLLGASLAAVAGGVVAVRTSWRLRDLADELLLRLPIIGGIARKIMLARFANFFSIMYAAGITVLDCLRAGEDIVGNAVLREAVRDAGRRIRDGGGISASFAQTELFPPLVIRMLRVGEQSGALEQALNNVCYFYTRDVREAIDQGQALLSPVLIVVLGLFLLWIIAAIFGPIYDLIAQIRI
ncbi:MAG: type II secretion system F family protein [Gammaproteobacteria bacterium]|nr:type II secretion system F family protein [Gammaproteobacteria bacterium]